MLDNCEINENCNFPRAQAKLLKLQFYASNSLKPKDIQHLLYDIWQPSKLDEPTEIVAD